MNVYRGCTHGCIYCDSRSDCYKINHPFEDIEVKQNAPILLDDILRRKRAACMIGTGAMCDPYMHCERDLRITRKCLEVIEKYNFGAVVLTKSDRILDDIDIYQRINDKSKAVAQLTLTTSDEKLCKIIEPNVCGTKRRYEVLKKFQERGIPTVVWLCPILPYINDTEQNLCEILDYCFDAGVKGIINYGFGVTLRGGNREYFYSKLDEHFPDMKKKYIDKFGYSYECESENARKLTDIFIKKCKSFNVMYNVKQIFSYLYEYPYENEQISIFD